GNIAYKKLNNDEERSAKFILPLLLDAGINILLYNGEYDLICNWIGTRDFAAHLTNWSGDEDFNNATYADWKLNDGSIVGHYKRYSGLIELMVYNAGHMSPFDQREPTQDMLNRFLDNSFPDTI